MAHTTMYPTASAGTTCTTTATTVVDKANFIGGIIKISKIHLTNTQTATEAVNVYDGDPSGSSYVKMWPEILLPYINDADYKRVTETITFDPPWILQYNTLKVDTTSSNGCTCLVEMVVE